MHACTPTEQTACTHMSARISENKRFFANTRNLRWACANLHVFMQERCAYCTKAACMHWKHAYPHTCWSMRAPHIGTLTLVCLPIGLTFYPTMISCIFPSMHKEQRKARAWGMFVDHPGYYHARRSRIVHCARCAAPRGARSARAQLDQRGRTHRHPSHHDNGIDLLGKIVNTPAVRRGGQ